MPFFQEQGRVSFNQCIGTPSFFRRLLVAISFREACMPEMMNKCIMAEEKIPSLLQDAQRVVVILEVAGAELFIKKPHLVEHFPLEEIAKSHKCRLLCNCFLFQKHTLPARLLQRQHITPCKTGLLFLQDTSEIFNNLRIERFAAIILSNDIKKSIQGNLQLLRLDSFALKIYAFFHQSLFFF